MFIGFSSKSNTDDTDQTDFHGSMRIRVIRVLRPDGDPFSYQDTESTAVFKLISVFSVLSVVLTFRIGSKGVRAIDAPDSCKKEN